MSELQLASLKGVELVGRSANTPARVSAGNDNVQWLGLDGAAVSMPWKQALVLEGRCFNITIGALSTPIVGGGNGTVPELAEPEFIISVPAGSAIIPLHVQVECEADDAVANHDALEIVLSVDRAKADDASGTATTETAYNLRTDNPRASVCTCRSAFTADVTAPTQSFELARTEVKIDLPANGETPVIVAMDYQPQVAPIIVGPAMLWGMWGGTSALAGYAQITWAEFQKSELGIA